MRAFHWLYARLHGYFWMECPHCGRMFGGHERGGRIETSPNMGVVTCNSCKYVQLFSKNP